MRKLTTPQAMVLAALIALAQGLGVVWIQGSIEKMERQINSNMERQMRQAVAEAVAQERLRVERQEPE